MKQVIDGVEFLLEAPGASRLLGETGMGELQTHIQANFQTSFNGLQKSVMEQAKAYVSVAPAGILLLSRVLQALEGEGVPLVMEAAAEKFPGTGASSAAPPFVAGEVMRSLKADAEELLQSYILAQTRGIGKPFLSMIDDANLLEADSPTQVRDFAKDMMLQIIALGNDTSQLIPGAMAQTEPTSASITWTQPRAAPTSGTSSSDVAKLFQQKVDLFTPLSFTYASVIAAIMKKMIKDFIEHVRQRTWGGHALQQMQVDTYYLRGTLPTHLAEDGAIDSLLDDLLVSIVDRCLDPTPLSSDQVLGIMSTIT